MSKLEFPEGEMRIKGWVSLIGVDLNNPLPVQLRDAKGNPLNLFENLTQIVGGGGGIAKTISVGGIQSSAFGNILNADGRLRVETNDSGTAVAEDAVHASGDTGFMALSVRNSTNTTFAADGDYQPIATDGIGRAITRPVQTRGLLQTAYASITTGTEATLLAGVAGTYFDLVYVMGTNNSDAAVTVDLRSATGGGIVSSVRIPANGTAGVSLAVPLPQDVAADTWTIDMPDISGTTVTVSALFSREV